MNCPTWPADGDRIGVAEHHASGGAVEGLIDPFGQAEVVRRIGGGRTRRDLVDRGVERRRQLGGPPVEIPRHHADDADDRDDAAEDHQRDRSTAWNRSREPPDERSRDHGGHPSGEQQREDERSALDDRERDDDRDRGRGQRDQPAHGHEDGVPGG